MALKFIITEFDIDEALRLINEFQGKILKRDPRRFAGMTITGVEYIVEFPNDLSEARFLQTGHYFMNPTHIKKI